MDYDAVVDLKARKGLAAPLDKVNQFVPGAELVKKGAKGVFNDMFTGLMKGSSIFDDDDPTHKTAHQHKKR